MEEKVVSIEDRGKIDEQTELMNAKIAELETVLAGHNEVKNFLPSQVTRLQDEMIQDQILLFDGGLKQAVVAKLKAQQKQVEENVLRLRVSQLDAAVSKEEDSIYDLQKFRLTMEMMLNHRQIEISAHQDILRAQKRNLEESLSQLRADINRKKIRIDQFQKKHHLALMALGTDKEGQSLSITLFKIKDGQELYMLQQEGDELDNKIKKAEKEIVVMENTLKVVNMTNIAYRKSLAPFQEDNEDHLEMTQLEQQIRNTTLLLKQQKKALSEKRKALKQLQESIGIVQERMEEEQNRLEEIEKMYVRLKEEEASREHRLAKTIRDVKIYKKRVPKPNLEKPERNLEIRQLQDANKEVFHQLRILLSDHEEITSIVTDLLRNCGLEMPQEPRSRTSTSSSSMVKLTKSSRSTISTSSSDSCSALTPVVLSFEEAQKPKG